MPAQNRKYYIVFFSVFFVLVFIQYLGYESILVQVKMKGFISPLPFKPGFQLATLTPNWLNCLWAIQTNVVVLTHFCKSNCTKLFKESFQWPECKIKFNAGIMRSVAIDQAVKQTCLPFRFNIHVFTNYLYLHMSIEFPPMLRYKTCLFKDFRIF